MRQGIIHLKRADPVLKSIIESVGPYRIEYRPPDFDTLVRSIVFQQLSGRVARVIYNRLADACTETGVCPDAILKFRVAKMRKFGLSAAKTDYIRDLARHTAAGLIEYHRFDALPDEQIIAELTAVKGIGVWTAQMFLIFALRRPDVLPTGDLGVRNAIRRAYNLEAPPKPKEIEEIGRPWRPYASIASWYLWRSLEGEAAL